MGVTVGVLLTLDGAASILLGQLLADVPARYARHGARVPDDVENLLADVRKAAHLAGISQSPAGSSQNVAAGSLGDARSLLGVDEVAALCHVSASKVRRAQSSGSLSARRVGKRKLVFEEWEVQKWRRTL